MNTQATITWMDKREMCPGKVAKGIKELLTEEFEYSSGLWRVQPLEHTRPIIGKVQFRNITEDPLRGTYLKYACRPYDNGSCWEVAVFPPPGVRLEDVAARYQDEAEDTPDRKSQPKRRPVVGQAYRVVAKSRLPYGLVVDVPELGREGLVTLDQISQGYDRGNLNKYNIGESLKALILDAPSTGRLKMSIESAKVVTGTNRINDVFTGIPDSNGELSLQGYSKDQNRRAKIMEWLKEAALIADPEPIPKADAAKIVAEKLCAEYNAKTVSIRVVTRLIQSLEEMKFPWLMTSPDRSGFIFTDFGWEEFGGRHLPDKPRTAKPVMPESMPPPEPTVRARPEPDKPRIKLSNDPAWLAQRAAEEDYGCVSARPEPKFNITEYVRMTARYIELSASIDVLLAEKAGIESWFQTNKDEIAKLTTQLGIK